MEKTLNVKLLKYTPAPADVVAQAARLCYYKSDIDSLLENMDSEKCERLLIKLVDLGHESPIEHAVFTFGIEGVSRALTHQLVRHRIASYSHQSQRYVDGRDFDYIVPPSIKKDPGALKRFEELMDKIGEAYVGLRDIAPKEDARFVLPNAAETKIIVTMNARSLKNFFKHRCCVRAQWEIRALANEMLKLCKDAAPALFAKMGASCMADKICPEGNMSCRVWENIEGAMIRLDGRLLDKGGYNDAKKK